MKVTVSIKTAALLQEDDSERIQSQFKRMLLRGLFDNDKKNLEWLGFHVAKIAQR